MPQFRGTRHAAEAKRVGKFGLVGALNTLADFVIFNLLHFQLGLGVIQANIVSTTIAMGFSFVMNKRVVFGHHHGRITHQAIMFFVGTAFGLYVLQTSIIALLTSIWPQPLQAVAAIIHVTIPGQHLSDTFIINNGAKAIATLASMTWNYLIYKKVVFKA